MRTCSIDCSDGSIRRRIGASSRRAPWLEEFVAELLAFPGRHDDQVCWRQSRPNCDSRAIWYSSLVVKGLTGVERGETFKYTPLSSANSYSVSSSNFARTSPGLNHTAGVVVPVTERKG
jgi:hypothetical protein